MTDYANYSNYTNEELIRWHSGSHDPLIAVLVERLFTALTKNEEAQVAELEDEVYAAQDEVDELRDLVAELEGA